MTPFVYATDKLVSWIPEFWSLVGGEISVNWNRQRQSWMGEAYGDVSDSNQTPQMKKHFELALMRP